MAKEKKRTLIQNSVIEGGRKIRNMSTVSRRFLKLKLNHTLTSTFINRE
jgi:hypothetical protein